MSNAFCFAGGGNSRKEIEALQAQVDTLESQVQTLQNSVKYKSGSGKVDKTTCTEGSIKWYKWGRVVMVIMSVTPDKGKMTAAWKDYRVDTGCPKAVANGNGFAVSTDTLDRVNYIEPRTDGTLNLHVRDIAMSSVGGTPKINCSFTYIAAS